MDVRQKKVGRRGRETSSGKMMPRRKETEVFGEGKNWGNTITKKVARLICCATAE